MRPVRAKALKLLAIYNAFALTGRQPCEHDNPGRCPGLRASAPSGRAAYMDFWPFRALPWAKTSAPQGVPTIQIATFSVVYRFELTTLRVNYNYPKHNLQLTKSIIFNYPKATDYHKTKTKSIKLTDTIWLFTQIVVPLQRKQNN